MKCLGYHLVIFSPLDHVHVQQLVLQIHYPHFIIIINHAPKLLCFLAFVRNPLCVSHCGMLTPRLHFFSRHFGTVTGPEYLATISPFSCFISFTSLGMFFRFSFSVPAQTVQYSIYSFLTNSGLLKKFSIHNVCPQPNKGSKSSNTTAAILRLLQLFVNFNVTTANTVTATITENFVRILHNFQHFTICQNFFSHCCALSITPESTAERSAPNVNMQGEYQQLQNVC